MRFPYRSSTVSGVLVAGWFEVHPDGTIEDRWAEREVSGESSWLRLPPYQYTPDSLESWMEKWIETDKYGGHFPPDCPMVQAARVALDYARSR